ncbi:catalase [Streptomyces sp. NPDC058892]|uniref:catalase n=1 Tax=unclassified Streptomyces TaxID=2593676 RepID=UPI0036796989
MSSHSFEDGARLADQVASATGADPSDRLLHTRGAWAAGAFTPSEIAASLSTAELFAVSSTPATVRFSSTLGGAHGHDGDPSDHGMAARIGGLDLVMFTLPVFFARTGADMVEFLRAANSPDPATAVPAYVARHPEAAVALDLAQQARPAASFTGLTYHSVHAFGLLDPTGMTLWARLSWRPLRAAQPLIPEESRSRPRDYLRAGLHAELPDRFDLVAHLPAAQDEVHDPTRLWSSEQSVTLGTLTLERAEVPASEPGFDPLRLPQGIAAPLDRLARDRSAAYLAAQRRRRG